MADYAYLKKYAPGNNNWKPNTNPAVIPRARKTIAEIHSGNRVTVPMLESILSLSAHPNALHLLVVPSLLHLCIVKLSQADAASRTEIGYLYFRVLVLALGVCIVARDGDTSDSVMEELRQRALKEDPTPLLMEHVARGVSKQMMDDSRPDYFLGWVPDGPRPLVAAESVVLLLGALWDDRKRFLSVWAATESPRLNGIMFILWRCVENYGTPVQWGAVCDIFWRYTLVARPDDIVRLGNISKRTGEHHNLWLEYAVYTGVEDSRAKLQLMTRRVTSASRLDPPIDGRRIVDMGLVATPRTGMGPRVEDLFVPHLTALFEYFWVSMAHPGRPLCLKPVEALLAVAPASLMLIHLIEHGVERLFPIIVKAIVELGVIEALAQAFLAQSQSGSIHSKSGRLFADTCNSFTVTLSRFEPTIYREAPFASAFPEWLKAFRYISTRDNMFETGIQRSSEYMEIQSSWIALAGMVGYDKQMEAVTAWSGSCANPRCPDPDSVKISRFECLCGATYCSVRCQQTDWVLELPTSHRPMCAKYQAPRWTFSVGDLGVESNGFSQA